MCTHWPLSLLLPCFFFFRQSAFLGCASHGSCIPTTLHLGCCCLIPECYSGFFFFFFFINYIVTYPLSLFSGSEEDVSFFFFWWILLRLCFWVLTTRACTTIWRHFWEYLSWQFSPFFFLPRLSLLEVVAFFFFFRCLLNYCRCSTLFSPERLALCVCVCFLSPILVLMWAASFFFFSLVVVENAQYRFSMKLCDVRPPKMIFHFWWITRGLLFFCFFFFTMCSSDSLHLLSKGGKRK